MRPPNVANRKEAAFDTGIARRGRGELAPGRKEPELAVRIEVAASEGEGLQTGRAALQARVGRFGLATTSPGARPRRSD